MRSERWIGAAIFALALALRLAHLQQVVANDPFYTQPSVDSLVYREWAMRIAGGDWLGSEPFFLSPLYAYVLGVLYSAFGASHFAPLALNALLGAAMVWLVYRLGLRLFDQRVALVAAALAATYRMEIFYEGAALVETLQTFLTAALALTSVAAPERPALARWAGVGALVGVSALARQNALLFAPLLAALAFTPLVAERALARRAAIAAALLAGAALVVLPATVRNYAVSGDVVLVNSTGGILMYTGWNPEATGVYTVPSILPRALADDPIEQKNAYRWLAEQRTGRKLAPSEVSTYWRGEALRFALENPAHALRLALWKGRLFWSAFEAWDNRSFTVSRPTSWVLRLSPVSFALVAPLALLGIALTLGRWRKLVPLYSIVLVHFVTAVLFIALSRYRIPVLPALVLFAGAGLVGAFDLRARAWPRAAVAAGVLAAAALLVNFRTPEEHLEMAHFNLGNAYNELGRYDKAVESYFESLKLDPGYISTWNNLALTYERSGVERELVIRTWQRVLELGRAQGSGLHVERAERHLRALSPPE
jgi:4-amino-4-deoxy-L-arabinose transferase-like glycosyltransferase